jgi:hypothetical protein
MEPNPTFEFGPKVLLKTKNCMESFFFGQLFHARDVSWHAIYLIKKIKSRVFRVLLICKIGGVQKKEKEKMRGNFFV